MKINNTPTCLYASYSSLNNKEYNFKHLIYFLLT